MATKKYKFGKGKSAPAAIHTDLPGGQHQAVGIGNLRVFIVPDGKFWFAQGLEIDYAAQGDSVDEAKKNFEEGLEATIDLHLRMYGSIDKILRLAPSEVLQEAARNAESIKLYWQVSVHEIVKAEEPLPFGGIDYYLLEKEAA
jgi:hypothetical protein